VQRLQSEPSAETRRKQLSLIPDHAASTKRRIAKSVKKPGSLGKKT
jgi:hypothetical protein